MSRQATSEEIDKSLQLTYPFCAYFNKAKSEGLTDCEAYLFAITEDIYDPYDRLLKSGDPRPDGMCSHPPICQIDYYNTSLCGICGTELKLYLLYVEDGQTKRKWSKLGPSLSSHCQPIKEIHWAPAVKLRTRSEQFLATLKAMKAVADETE